MFLQVHLVLLNMKRPDDDLLDFSSKHYGSVYTEHSKSLSKIYRDKPPAFKFLLKEIYDIARYV